MPSSESEKLLVALLLDVPRGDRAAFLQRACSANPALKERVADIERAVAGAEGRAAGANAALDMPAIRRVMDVALSTSAGETAGEWVGPYKLLQKIGEGGFGVVWMAEQSEPIRRRVAVKILKGGMDTKEIVARFEAERQALALMNHPNIAQVFDAGATLAGRPYVAMELVRGTALTKFCDDSKLSAEARLRLFTAVCDGVQHAHQKGVIHRDLKPSNILVTLHDGVPVPKIIDFGIAKATTGLRLTDKTLFTQFHAFVGTPVYTSPEQMEMSGLDVDTRSDIYSLGVLLYELLAGRPPFDPDALAKSGLDAMRRTIRDQEPPRPSLRLATLSVADRTEVARRRSAESSKLVAAMRGDLDWIVMRCLEKDRTRRYATANALADDIGRHLKHQPVEAHAPSTVYRAQKFIRRHRLGVVAAGGVFVSLLLGVVVSLVLLARERSASARATASERIETSLRKQAEVARETETARASRTARDLGEQHLASGRSAEGLAWLVHAARTNPRDMTIAPRLASALVSRTFLLPVGPPLRLPSRVTNVHYFAGGRKIGACSADGTVGVIDTATGMQSELKLPARVAAVGMRFNGHYAVVPGVDNVIRVVNPDTMRVEHEFGFTRKIVRLSVRRENEPYILAVLEEGALVVVDAATGLRRTLPPIMSNTTGGVLSDDGRWFAVADVGTRLVQVWDTTTGERCGITGSLGVMRWVAFSPDGTRVVSVGGSENQLTFAVHALPDGTDVVPPTLLPQQLGNSAVVTISPDGRVVCIASRSGYQLYALETGEPIGRFCETGILSNSADEFRTAFRGIGSYIGSFTGILLRRAGDRLQTIAPTNFDAVVSLTVRDAVTGEPVFPAFAYAGGMTAARLTQDGNTLLAFGGGAILLWDLKRGCMLAEPYPQPDGDVTIAPDGREIVVGRRDGSVRRFHVGPPPARTLMLPRTLPSYPTAFFPDSPPRLFMVRRDRGFVVDASAGEVTKSVSFPEPLAGYRDNLLITGIRTAIRPDLRVMAVQVDAGGAWQAWTMVDGDIVRVAKLENAPAARGWAFFSRTTDEVAIAFNTPRPTILTWDTATGRRRGDPIVLASPVIATSFSQDARLMVAGGFLDSAEVWDRATARKIAKLPHEEDGLTLRIDASADGTRFLTNNRWGEAWLWDAATARRIGQPMVGGGAQFSVSGEQVLTVSEVGARVWDGRTGEPQGVPMAHSGVAIRAAEFSRDARRVATAAQDSTARIWDAATGQPLSDPLVHGSRVVSCEFSPDGRFLRTEQAFSPTCFRLWPVPPDSRGQPAPEWLLQLATVCAEKTIDASDHCVDAPDAADRLENIRRTLATSSDDAPFVTWGRWILDDRADRPIAPEFSATAADADKLAAALTP